MTHVNHNNIYDIDITTDELLLQSLISFSSRYESDFNIGSVTNGKIDFLILLGNILHDRSVTTHSECNILIDLCTNC
jgi:hypothetical protein